MANIQKIHQIANGISAFVTAYQVAEWQNDNGVEVGDPAVIASNAVVENSGNLKGCLRVLVSKFISLDSKLDCDGLQFIGLALKEYADAYDTMHWMVDQGIKLELEIQQEAYCFAITYKDKRELLDDALKMISEIAE